MITSVIFVCCTVWIVFGDYFDAKAQLIAEQARALEIENDKKEMQ